MTIRHMPVMLDEVLAALAPRDGGLYVDATFGAGGYTRALLGEASCRVIAIDRDPSVRPMAEAARRASGGRLAFALARFSQLAETVALAGADQVDGVVMDVGVSSMQLDQGERGFSFRFDGPLDMRMGADGPSAADALAQLDEAQLTEVLRVYGEERQAGRVARAITRARRDAPLTTTAALADLVARTLGPGDGRVNPATKVFQALRILVNDELGELAAGLHAAEQVLAAGGRLVVVSFHSLEDRLVKTFLRRRAGMEGGVSRHMPAPADGPAGSFRLAFNGARTPEEAELVDNPRARSAKLRAGVRTSAPAWPLSDGDAPPRVAAQAMFASSQAPASFGEASALVTDAAPEGDR